MTSAETLSPPPRELRPHQRDAVNAVDTSLARQQVIMACGTGKTITGMHAVAKLLGGARGRVLLLVPTLTLLEQTYAAWLADAPFDFDALAVCSKLSATDRRAVGVESDADVDELSLRATTEPDAVAAFLTGAGTRIVFATYQSLGAIVNAHRDGAPHWNVIVCDEAHRTAGAAGKAFGRVLRDEHVPGDRRLFLTATPRVHTVATKASYTGGETLLMSMDDENVYGPQVYTLSVAEAVERAILSQYQVAVIGVSDAELSSAAQVLDTIMVDGHELKADHVASIIALSKAARSNGLHSVIAYFNSKAASRAFVKAFQIVHAARSMLLAGGTAEHIDGDMKLADRAASLSRLAAVHDDGFHLVSNARCLTEGIDVPVLDGVLFGEPRSSQIDVVQCVGRAIRKNPRTDDPALIVLAVRTGDGQDVETAIAEAGFAKVRQVIAALGDHDPRIAEAARTLSRHRGDDTDHSGDRPTREELDAARQLISLNIPEELLHNGFGLRMLLDEDEQAWERGYAAALEFTRANDHARVPLRHVTVDGIRLGGWVSKQREAFRDEALSVERVARLEALPSWVWDVFGDRWARGFSAAKEFSDRNGHARVPDGYTTVDGFRLGGWVSEQRKDYRNGRLAEDRAARLETLPEWSWDVRDKRWELGLAAAEAFGRRNGHTRVPDGHTTVGGFRLGGWVSKQREAYRCGTLSEDRAERLESLPKWSWGVRDRRWEQGFAAAGDFGRRHGHSRIPRRHVTVGGFRLGAWIGNQKTAFHGGRLSADRIARLESLPGWSWNQLDERWESGIVAAREFGRINGHTRVPGDHITAEGFRLGQWICNQRTAFRSGALSTERKVRLEALPKWSWDLLDERWEQGLASAIEFGRRNGHTRVPQRYRAADGYGLGQWISHRRKEYRAGSLPADRIARLESLPGWSWNQLDERWESGIVAAREFGRINGHTRVPGDHITAEGFRLGQWICNQRTAFRSGALSTERKVRLEALPRWSWAVLAGQWEHGLDEAREFGRMHGHTCVPGDHITGESFRLGKWVRRQRSTYRAGKLSADRVARLEALPGWVWDARA